MLSISSLRVSLKAIPILRGVTLEAPAGEIVGLIGRNGAGKTTTLRGVIGLLPAQAGRIEFDGQDLLAVPVHRRAALGIGYMPEERRLIPHFTVEDNVLLPAWANRIADPEARLRRIQAEIPEVRVMATRKAFTLSGGQQKLVALARALMIGSKLLLLDEPFEGVAPVLSQRLAEVIARLKGTGLAVLIAESDLKHVARLVQRTYVIERGETAQAGDGGSEGGEP